jgi:hypothetical protein
MARRGRHIRTMAHVVPLVSDAHTPSISLTHTFSLAFFQMIEAAAPILHATEVVATDGHVSLLLAAAGAVRTWPTAHGAGRRR